MAGMKTGWAGQLFELPEADMGSGITRRTVFGPERFWEDYTARLFTMEKGGSVTPHSHDWPHYVLVLNGQGVAEVEGERVELSPMSWVSVAPNLKHHFEQTGEEPLSFICIVPTRGDVPPGKLEG